MTAAADRLPLTVVIATLNEGARLGDAIRSVAWASEVIVADGGSTDDTERVARALGAVFVACAGTTIGGQRNAAIERAAHDWILALDADERADPVLRDQIAGVIAQRAFDVYRVRRRNTYLGRVMRHGEMARDWHVCLFRRAHRYNGSRVHEHLVDLGRTGRLAGPIAHEPYRDLAHHAEKIVRYEGWAAEDRFARGRRASLAELVLRAPLRFFRAYVAYGGWLDGWRGAVAAMMSGYAAFLRAAFLRDLAETR